MIMQPHQRRRRDALLERLCRPIGSSRDSAQVSRMVLRGHVTRSGTSHAASHANRRKSHAASHAKRREDHVVDAEVEAGRLAHYAFPFRSLHDDDGVSVTHVTSQLKRADLALAQRMKKLRRKMQRRRASSSTSKHARRRRRKADGDENDNGNSRPETTHGDEKKQDRVDEVSPSSSMDSIPEIKPAVKRRFRPQTAPLSGRRRGRPEAKQTPKQQQTKPKRRMRGSASAKQLRTPAATAGADVTLKIPRRMSSAFASGSQRLVQLNRLVDSCFSVQKVRVRRVASAPPRRRRARRRRRKQQVKKEATVVQPPTPAPAPPPPPPPPPRERYSPFVDYGRAADRPHLYTFLRLLARHNVDAGIDDEYTFKDEFVVDFLQQSERSAFFKANDHIDTAWNCWHVLTTFVLADAKTRCEAIDPAAAEAALSQYRRESTLPPHRLVSPTVFDAARAQVESWFGRFWRSRAEFERHFQHIMNK
eukprot:TRINITY_DN60026_c0_g1_i1.p1 TRINITY_DN60026_c0_g1~~TRINITY_DN60026_c0_g1_i1.p1  ORF type:complete len:477 (-),score=167.92 TRINITY_DN60026_c0_g1_i1:71-1501(-)